MTPRPAEPPAALLGREDELGAIEQALEQGGLRGAILALTGEPGIGKTALLAAARAAAAGRGRQVLSCSGFEVETHLPFAALYELLEPVLDQSSALPDAERQALLAAFGMAEGAQPEPFLIAAAVQGMLSTAARHRPVTVLIDDAQWLDPPSADCLAVVARRVAASTAPVCLIATVRLDAPGPMPAVLTAIDRRVVVQPLSETAAATLLRRAAPSLSGVERQRIEQQAQGNPLALIELPGMWHPDETGTDVSALSDRLARDFGGRCAELPAGTRDALLVAAINDRLDTDETLTAAGILAGRAVDRAELAAAADAGLVLLDHDRLRFRHPLVRSGIVHTELLSRRQSAHAALAEVVATPYRQAWHRAQSIIGPDDAVADALEATVAASLRRGAVLTAISSLERAAELTVSPTRRGRRLLAAAEHAFGLGRTQLVHRLVSVASRGELDDLDLARVQWLREIFNDGVPGDAGRVRELCDIADRSAAAGEVDLALNLLLGAALRCWWADTGPDARARVVQSVTALHAGGDARSIAAVAVAEPVLRAAAVTAALAAAPVSAVEDADGLRLLGMAAHAIGDSARADDYLSAAEAMLRTQHRLGVLVHALSMHVIVLLEIGDWDRAAVASSEAMALAGDTGQPIWTAGSIACEAIGLALRGDAPAAFDMAARSEMIAHRSRLNDLLSVAGLARGIALLTLDRDDEAFETLRQLLDPADPTYHHREGMGGLMFLAEAAVRSGRVREARDIVGGLDPIAAITPTPILHLHLGYARAVLADPTSAERLFRTALAAPELPRWPWIQARTQLAFGSWLSRHDRASEAGGLLTAALATFDRIGATHWSRQAHQLRTTHLG
ncbi:AAA family ATPase [Actinoplanes sp. CA-030573]|uniref:AAA family ATPase n=1 Tax=Actinoplanes sp. CA-030573 TaxID=3239898 RepID=UPI003D89FF53